MGRKQKSATPWLLERVRSAFSEQASVARVSASVLNTLSLDTRSIVAFRALFGLVVAADVVDRWRNAAAHYSDVGVLLRAIVFQTGEDSLQLHAVGGTAFYTHLLFVVHVAAALAFAVGWRTRAATATLYALTLSLYHRNVGVSRYYDDGLVCVVLFWSLFLPLAPTWSLDTFWRRRKHQLVDARSHRVLSVASACVVVQLVLALFASALFHLHDPFWIDGSALSRALRVSYLRKALFGNVLAASPPWLLAALTRAYNHLECVAPLLIMSPVFNAQARCAGIALLLVAHALLAAALQLGVWQPAWACALVLLLPGAFWNGSLFRPHHVLDVGLLERKRKAPGDHTVAAADADAAAVDAADAAALDDEIDDIYESDDSDDERNSAVQLPAAAAAAAANKPLRMYYSSTTFSRRVVDFLTVFFAPVATRAPLPIAELDAGTLHHRVVGGGGGDGDASSSSSAASPPPVHYLAVQRGRAVSTRCYNWEAILCVVAESTPITRPPRSAASVATSPTSPTAASASASRRRRVGSNASVWQKLYSPRLRRLLLSLPSWFLLVLDVHEMCTSSETAEREQLAKTTQDAGTSSDRRRAPPTSARFVDDADDADDDDHDHDHDHDHDDADADMDGDVVGAVPVARSARGGGKLGDDHNVDRDDEYEARRSAAAVLANMGPPPPDRVFVSAAAGASSSKTAMRVLVGLFLLGTLSMCVVLALQHSTTDGHHFHRNAPLLAGGHLLPRAMPLGEWLGAMSWSLLTRIGLEQDWRLLRHHNLLFDHVLAIQGESDDEHERNELLYFFADASAVPADNVDPQSLPPLSMRERLFGPRGGGIALDLRQPQHETTHVVAHPPSFRWLRFLQSVSAELLFEDEKDEDLVQFPTAFTVGLVEWICRENRRVLGSAWRQHERKPPTGEQVSENMYGYHVDTVSIYVVTADVVLGEYRTTKLFNMHCGSDEDEWQQLAANARSQ